MIEQPPQINALQLAIAYRADDDPVIGRGLAEVAVVHQQITLVRRGDQKLQMLLLPIVRQQKINRRRKQADRGQCNAPPDVPRAALARRMARLNAAAENVSCNCGSAIESAASSAGSVSARRLIRIRGELD